MIDAPTQILTIEELAQFLKMTRRQVYNLTRARGQARMTNPLPVLRINGNVRFRKCDVEAWLARLAGGESPYLATLLAERQGEVDPRYSKACEMFKRGSTYQEIQAELHISPSTVANWKKKWTEDFDKVNATGTTLVK